jgi:hypothetical protein
VPASQHSEGSAGHGPAEPLHSGGSSSSEADASGAETTAAHDDAGHDDAGQSAETAPQAGPHPGGLDEATGGEAAAGSDAPAQRSAPALAGAGGSVGRAWRTFRRWRRSRPFWGALIALLGGAEIALSERLPLAIVVHLGAQGIAGLLVPIVLMLCAVLLWFNPAQRLFYSILAVLCALGSFITSNLGGFVLGGLLGIVGGSLAFAWAPDNGRHRDEEREDETGPENGPQNGPPDGLALLLGDSDREGESDGPSTTGSTLHAVSVPVALAMLASVLHPLLTTALASLGLLVAAVTVNASTLATSGPNTTADLISPSPTASSSPSPSLSATPSPSPSPTASPTSSAPSPPSLPRQIWKQAAASALGVSQVQSSLTAGSAHLEGLSYDGVASVPTASGGSVDMLKFSMSSMALSGGTKLTVNEGGITAVTSSPSLAFSGNVVLYTTKISGELLGIPFTYTPDSPPPLLLPDIDFSNVQTEQPFAVVGALTADGVRVSAS